MTKRPSRAKKQPEVKVTQDTAAEVPPAHGRDIKPQEEETKTKPMRSKSAPKSITRAPAAKPKTPAKTKAPASRKKSPSPNKVAKVEAPAEETKSPAKSHARKTPVLDQRVSVMF